MDDAPPVRTSTRSPRVGRWLSLEGVIWLGILLLLFAVGFAKNINLVSLLASMLAAVLLLSAVLVGRRLRRLKVHRTQLTERSAAGRLPGAYREGGEWFAVCGDGKVLRLLEAFNDVLIQPLVSDGTIVALDVGVLLWLTRLDML